MNKQLYSIENWNKVLNYAYLCNGTEAEQDH